jgi:hypothetical protein
MPSSRSRLSAFVTFAAAGVFVLVLVYMLSSTLATHKRSRIVNAWAASLGSEADLMARHPSRETNESALEVERLAAAVGVDMAPRSAGEDRRPAPRDGDAYKVVKRAVAEYLERQIERPEAGFAMPPDSVAGFLSDRADELGALRAHLLHGPQPLWALRIEQLANSPAPNLMGQINVLQLLLADALARAATGDGEGAQDSFEASWRLTTALRDDPLLVAQTIAISNTRLQAGVLRRLESVPEGWRERLYEHDYRRSLLEGLQLESWTWMRLDDPGTLYEISPLQRAVAAVARPYARYCTADLSEVWLRRLVELSELDYLCDRDVDVDMTVPRWNFVGRFALPGVSGVVERVARLEVDLELTAKILELRAARDANGGAWVASLPGIESSRACPRDRWLYEVDRGGGMSIALDRAIDWADARGAVLPTRYVAPSRP